jgi:hypothetical protein|tara:strand:+ start:300 stop:539 length:240 start_codon:yes stop_codon:yes gene_type:complete
MELLKSYWHQVLFLITTIIVAVRLESEVRSLRKDLNSLEKESERRDVYVETVKQQSEIDILKKQVSALWDFVNRLRDRF